MSSRPLLHLNVIKCPHIKLYSALFCYSHTCLYIVFALFTKSFNHVRFLCAAICMNNIILRYILPKKVFCIDEQL